MVTRSFKPEYDNIRWQNDHAQFAAWCEGRTGYPIVDAAMRQLNQTGYMHNRLRMIAASFLTNDLLVDWRWGERYFADKLNDYDLAANNGGWQWAASTGCDAALFPHLQSGQPERKIRYPWRVHPQYVPEVAMLSDRDIHAHGWHRRSSSGRATFVPGRDYPLPIVDHAAARGRTLAEFKRALGSKASAGVRMEGMKLRYDASQHFPIRGPDEKS